LASLAAACSAYAWSLKFPRPDRDSERVRCFTRNGNDWADRFPAIVEAAARLEAQSFLIDGEVVVARDDGMPDFYALRSRRRGYEAVLFAFRPDRA
jgi:bifunctional non-homologous end joining protein LigD